MNVATIEMDWAEALERLGLTALDNHADSAEFNRRCEVAYNELAEGRKLVNLSRSIQRGGLDENHRPKLAICRADRQEVLFVWRPRNRFASFVGHSNYWTLDRWPGLVRTVDMGVRNPASYSQEIGGGARQVEGYALVPRVPAHVRPETGQLRDWWVLWEVEEWFDQPQRMTAPVDPYLLKHIGGELYSVLAEWDLTEVERAIMEELQG